MQVLTTFSTKPPSWDSKRSTFSGFILISVSLVQLLVQLLVVLEESCLVRCSAGQLTATGYQFSEMYLAHMLPVVGARSCARLRRRCTWSYYMEVPGHGVL